MANDDWLTDLPDGSGTGELVPVKVPAPALLRSAEEIRIEKMRSIEDELLETNLAIMRDVSAFRDIMPDTEYPPQEWLDKYGYEESYKRLRVARASWMSAKEAPVALAISKSLTVGIIRARATEKTAPRSLNIALVQMTAPSQVFEEKEIE